MSTTTAGRGLTSGMITEVSADQLGVLVFVELMFSTPVRLWSGYGDISYGGETYQGIGTFGSISRIQETTDLAARGISLQLSGVPSEYIALALLEPYRDRLCRIIFAARDSAGAVVSDPIAVFVGRMDLMSIEDDATQAVINVTVESRLMDFLRTREVRYTHEEQQRLHPGDRGLEFVTAIQERPLYWGSAAAAGSSTVNYSGGSQSEGTTHE